MLIVLQQHPFLRRNLPPKKEIICFFILPKKKASYDVTLYDGDFLDSVREMIRSEGVTAEWALKVISEKYVRIFENIDDAILARKQAEQDVFGKVD